MKTKKESRFTRMTVTEFRRRASERSIQSAICDLMHLIRLPFSVTDGSLTFDDRGKFAGRSVLTDGWPDVCASLPPTGRLLAIETKSAGGRLRPTQVRCHAMLRESGALVIVPHSVNEFAEALVGVGIRHPVLLRLTKYE